MALIIALGFLGSQNWNNTWDFITQSGKDTGNNELQNYIPEQVSITNNGELDINLEKVQGNNYKSGKIKSKNSLTSWASEYGALEIEFVLPKNCMVNESSGSPSLVSGLWPAIWLLPSTGNWPTGGEIDLMEMMHFQGQPDRAENGFSTLHFGPAVNQDAVFDGQWGLRMASFKWDRTRMTQKIRFEWRRTENKTWHLTQWVNDKLSWSQLTSNVDNFANFEKGKKFRKGLLADDFATGAPGDPARIFQRAFDDSRMGLHVIANLAFGGTPWGEGSLNADLTLQKSILRIVNFRVWNMALMPPLPQQLISSDTEDENVRKTANDSLHLLLNSLHTLQSRALIGILNTESQQLFDYTEQLQAAAKELQKLSSDAAQAAISLSTLADSKIKQGPPDIR